jgi:uncharacterized RDD family membrane protein YckC
MAIRTEPKLLRRTLGTVIDYGLYLAFFIWLVVTYGKPNDEGGYTLSDEPESWWIFIGWLIYFPIIESIRGQTLGKMILGLRVVTKSGNQISFGQAFKRHLLDMFDFMFFGVVAFITITNTPDHQRLGDLWAKTIVIGGDTYDCPSCRDQLTLSADEIIKKEFVCPTCKRTVKL